MAITMQGAWTVAVKSKSAAFAQRFVNPRLEADPPPYRPSPALRGPIHLPVAYDKLIGN